MALATLSIDLDARLSRFEQDLGKAARLTEMQNAKMAASFNGLKVAMAGAFAGVSVAALASSFRATLDSIDALNDLKDATGSSIENISALEDVARRTGASFDTVGTSLVKFNNTLKEANATSDSGAVFKSLGLDIAALKQLDPAEALRQTAQALAVYADDGNKARLVQELFGKSVREVAPFLNDLAKVGQLNATVTTQQAEEAERFNHQLASLGKNIDDVKRGFTGDVVIALNAAADAFRAARIEGNLLTATLAALRGLSYGGDREKNNEALIQQTERLLKAENELAKSRVADAEFAKGFGGSGASPRTRRLQEAVDSIKSEISTTRSYRKLLDDEESAVKAKENAKPKLPAFAGKPTGAPKREEINEARRDLASYVEGLQRQLTVTQQLTEESKAQLQLASLGTLGQIPQVRELVLQLAKQVDATKAAEEAEKAIAKAREGASAGFTKHLESLHQQNEALFAGNERAREQLEEMGLEGEALDRLRLTRLDANLAREQEGLIIAQNVEGNEAEIAQIERRIRLLQLERSITAKSGQRRVEIEASDALKKRAEEEQKEGEKRRERIADSIENGLRDGFSKGGSLADVFIRELEARFSAVILRPVIDLAVGQFDGLMQGLLGGGKSSSGPSNPFDFASLFGLASFDVGTPYVQKDQIALIHKGERIVPARDNKPGSGGTTVVNINNTIGSVASQSDVVRGMAVVRQQMRADMMRAQSYAT